MDQSIPEQLTSYYDSDYRDPHPSSCTMNDFHINEHSHMRTGSYFATIESFFASLRMESSDSPCRTKKIKAVKKIAAHL